MNAQERWACWTALAVFVLMMSWCAGPGSWRDGVPELAAPRLFPDRVSVVVRLSDFEQAFSRHWRARGHADSDEATRHLLNAFGTWTQWTGDYGEAGARARLIAYREALYEIVGPETWLVLGAWESRGEPGVSEASNEPLIGLMLYVRETTSLRIAVTPLMNLMIPAHKIRKSEYRGIEVTEYLDESDRRAAVVARIGGWACVSLRQFGTDPVHRAIDRYFEIGADPDTKKLWAARDFDRDASVWAVDIDATLVWSQLDLLSAQREEGASAGAASRGSSKKWEGRLEGIDRITFVQQGASLLDFDLLLRGARIERVLDGIAERHAPLADDPEPEPYEFEEIDLAPSIMQFDADRAFLDFLFAEFDLEWEDFWEALDDLDWIAPGIGKILERMVEERNMDSGVHFGMALYPNEKLPIPSAGLWFDRAPTFISNLSPADQWRLRPVAERFVAGDHFEMAGFGRPAEGSVDSDSNLAQIAAGRLWGESASAPLLFLAMDFAAVSDWARGFPLLFLSRGDRRELIRIRALARALDIALGGLAVRVDAHDRGEPTLVLKVRTVSGEALAPGERAESGEGD